MLSETPSVLPGINSPYCTRISLLKDALTKDCSFKNTQICNTAEPVYPSLHVELLKDSGSTSQTVLHIIQL